MYVNVDKDLPMLEELGYNLRKQGFNVFYNEKGILLISQENVSDVERASFAIDQALDISYSTAEHHPYWILLYNSAEICKKALEHWNDNLTSEGIEELKWRTNKLKEFIDLVDMAKLKDKLKS